MEELREKQIKAITRRRELEVPDYQQQQDSVYASESLKVKVSADENGIKRFRFFWVTKDLRY